MKATNPQTIERKQKGAFPAFGGKSPGKSTYHLEFSVSRSRQNQDSSSISAVNADLSVRKLSRK